MKKKDFSALARSVQPHLPASVIKIPLIAFCPMDRILRGIYFENHSYRRDLFYVWAFYLPICVPTKYIYFDFGKRIEFRKEGVWNLRAPNLIVDLTTELIQIAVPFLETIKSLKDFEKTALSLHGTMSLRSLQAVAYIHAREGDTLQAIRLLDDLTSSLDLEYEWQISMKLQADELKFLLLHDTLGALKKLDDWEAETIRNLGLASVGCAK